MTDEIKYDEIKCSEKVGKNYRCCDGACKYVDCPGADCDQYDGYYCTTGNVRETRDYKCTADSNCNPKCIYDVTNTYDCDDRDSWSGDWVYYCEDDKVKKKRKWYDYYCSGSNGNANCNSYDTEWKTDTVATNGDDDYCDKKGDYCNGCSEGEYDCDTDDECASGLTCTGSWSCIGNECGCCPSGKEWDSEKNKCCECSSGSCCDGCSYKSSSTVCETITTENKCQGTSCGDDVLKRTKARYCSGSGNACTGSTGWTDWEVVQNCGDKQICSNNQCVNVNCCKDSDCGTTGWYGDPYCSGSKVKQKYRTWTCENPSTTSSKCSYKDEEKEKDDCSDEWTGSPYCYDDDVYQMNEDWSCKDGECILKKEEAKKKKDCPLGCESGECKGEACTTNTDCKNSPRLYCDTSTKTCVECLGNNNCNPDSWTGNQYCKDNDVYQMYRDYSCSSGQCSYKDTETLKQDCGSAGCSNNKCNIACYQNSECGTNIWLGDPYCKSNLKDIYQLFKGYTCNYPGTSSAFCSNKEEEKIKTTCSAGQLCNNAACVNVVDLTVKSLFANKNGKKVLISFRLKNVGQAAANNVYWKIDWGDGSSKSSTNPLSFSIGGEKLFFVRNTYTTSGSKTIKVTVDPANIISESNENNNELSRSVTI